MNQLLTIGERIGDLRVAKGLSQKELCKLIDVTPSQLSRIESGETKNINVEVLLKLSEEFNVSTDYILGLTNISTKKNYDISELGLSESAVKAFLSNAVDMQIMNKVVEHKHFPYLMVLIKRYHDGDAASGISNLNEMYDFTTATIADFAKDNPEYINEARDDIRNIKSAKMGENEAILGKINSVFMVIVRDIKCEDDNKAKSPVATSDFMQGIWERLADKPREEITEEDVSEAVTNMIKMKTDLDGVGATLFQKLMVRMLKKSQKK
jgi:transcriptional regulator with XRE-family HTH domain